MKRISLILLAILLAASCGRVVVDEPEFLPESVEEPDDIIIPLRYSPKSWKELKIDSHLWINDAIYDCRAKRWIINEKPESLEVFISSEVPLEGELYSNRDQSRTTWVLSTSSSFLYYRKKPFYFTSSGEDFFFLYRNGYTRCFGFRKKIDTTRVLVLDTIDQTEDPEAGDPGPINDED